MKKLVEDGSANNIKSAKKMVDKGRTEVWDALDEIIKDHPVNLRQRTALRRVTGYQLLLHGEIVRRTDHLVDVPYRLGC